MARTRSSERSPHSASETTPLLAESLQPVSTTDPGLAEAITTTPEDSTTTNTRSPSHSTSKPTDNSNATPSTLPKIQLLTLCLCATVEPIAFFSIFPYINAMVARNGNLPPSSVGFYSGLIESLFSLTQMSVMILWGRLADRIGRKPVLVASLSGVSCATVLFGFAHSIPQMIAFRCLAGVFAGTIVTIRTMVSEVSTKETQARAFSYFAVASNLGIFLGPLIGGALADPAMQYPSVFGRIEFFRRNPYALPTLTTGSIAVTATVTAALCLRETFVRKKIGGEEGEGAKKTMTIRQLVTSPGVPVTLYIFFHTMLLGVGYTAILPLYLYTPVELGGLGFPPLTISFAIGLIGIGQVTWLLLFFPPLQRRAGTKGVLQACATWWPLLFIGAPSFNVLLRAYGDKHAAWVVLYVLGGIFTLLGVGVAMAFTCVQLAVNAVAPGRETLATLGSVVLTINCAMRSVVPAAVSSLFAVGVEKQVARGYLVWIILAIWAAALRVVVRWLPEEKEEDVKGTTGHEAERAAS